MRIGAIFDEARVLAEARGMTIVQLVERLLTEWVAKVKRGEE
jgi:hypothetical protein